MKLEAKLALFLIINNLHVISELDFTLKFFSVPGGYGEKMMAYEFYWNDKDGKPHFIGSLPERRKNPERITWESIMNWGKMIIGDSGEVNNLSFVKIEV